MDNETPIARLVGHTVAEVERDLIIHTLSRHDGCRTRAADVLGLSVRTLRNRIREYTRLGIDVPAPSRAEARMTIDEIESSCVVDCPSPELAPAQSPRPVEN